MIKIAIADNNGLKFTKDLKEHWEKKGHEVRYERGASEHLAQWADLYYIDCWDNNMHYLSKLYNGDPDGHRPEGWDNNKKPRIVCRALDWEVWIGFVRDQSIIDWVDDIIYIAPHIKVQLDNHANFGSKLHLIKPGVNTERFTLKEKETDGFQLGMALGDMWWPKNHMAGLDIFTQLYKNDNRWRLHIRGQHEGGNEFWKQMYEYYLDSREIRDVVTLYPHVEDMNEWYENIDILLHPGMKEAFCYAVGEAMSKGIPAVVNDFYGVKDIWNHGFVYQTHDAAIRTIYALNKVVVGDSEKTLAKNCRNYIEENHSLDQMLRSYDALLGT